MTDTKSNGTEGAKTPAPQKTTAGTDLALLKKNITDSVMQRIQPMIESKEIRLPADYSIGNAIHSAWFALLDGKDKDGKAVLEVCTKESIANSLFKMGIMGLSVAKRQVAFIAYGNKLDCQVEYHGTIALAKRFGKVSQVNAGVIYQGDVFQYEVNVATGRKRIIKHEQEIENINDEKIRGAYAVITFTDNSEPYLEVMNMDQIRKAWNQGAMKGNSPAHKNFAGEMSKKSVINRACKLFISSSDDAALFEDDEATDLPLKARDEKIQDKGNKKAINTTDVEFEDISHSRKPEPIPAEQLEPQGPAKEELFQNNPGY